MELVILFIFTIAMFILAFVFGELRKAHRRVFWGAVLYGVVSAFKKKPEPIVHACPPGGTALTPCCQKSPLLLPRGDRMTVEASRVTCHGWEV